MKGVIVAAGIGTRLRPLTDTIPKAMVEVSGKPMILYTVEKMKEAGITEICIVVGYLPDKIKDYLGDGSSFGVKITYVVQEEQKGLAHAVACAEAFVNNEPFTVLLIDNFHKQVFSDILMAHTGSECEASIVVKEVEDPSQLGVAVLDESGNVQKILEKPKELISNFAAIGLYFFNSGKIFDVIRNLEPSARGEYEITDSIQKLIESGSKVQAIKLQGWWLDVGQFSDLEEAERKLAQKESNLDETGIEEDLDE